MARRAQLLEEPGTELREMPDAGMFAAADQITVAVHDLALVLSDEGQVEEVVELVAQAQKRAGV